jgi:Holliday junction resolvase RusA-like endonuclease
MPIFLTVLGEPASKANSRRIIRRGGRLMSIKSAKALSYADHFNAQVKAAPTLLEGELRVDMWIHYASQRPDLDESLILDLLQGKAYLNDRQVKERHVYHCIDKQNPRTTILIRPRYPREGLVEECVAASFR